MRKYLCVVFAFFTLPLFAVKYDVVYSRGFNQWIVINPADKTSENLKSLGNELRELNKSKNTAFAYIYDDRKAALMFDRTGISLTKEEDDFYDKHFIAVFWKGIGENTRYDFTIMIDGLNGKTERIKFDRKDDLEAANKIEVENDTESESDKIARQEQIDKEGKIVGRIMLTWLFLIVLSIFMLVKHRQNRWTKFIVCLSLGCFGVHKFMEKRIGWGIAYILTVGLWLLGWAFDTIRYLYYALLNKEPPVKVSKKRLTKELEEKIKTTQESMIALIRTSGELPIVNDAPIVMKQGEVCHFSQEANSVEIKNVVIGRKSTGGARSATLFGVRYTAGGSQSQSIRGDVATKTPGVLTITSERIIFSGRKGAFNKKISEITSFVPENDTIGIQFNEKYHLLQIRTVDLVVAILQTLMNQRI